ncbi:PREDICTED: BRCA2 and CDKN1A-interacting protein [Ficedula albicollis]|uniref:BRCA2 and CDKN1A-interacting protein n=1 Tax=Ficedula albicollis TaxID=59894 RepID=UPI0007AD969E|nr:PREDICTED: BRCA2 and CDKN1A-interacting protein [Ficedula albicollis]
MATPAKRRARGPAGEQGSHSGGRGNSRGVFGVRGTGPHGFQSGLLGDVRNNPHAFLRGFSQGLSAWIKPLCRKSLWLQQVQLCEPEGRSKALEEVNIEFEAHSISDNDYNGIKKLLQQLFLKAPVNTAELTDILIQQNHIGSIIKQAEVQEDSSDDEEDDDEVFGFISCLNLTERKGTQCAEQIKELLLSRCEQSCEQRVVEQLSKLLNDSTKPVGLILSERFINVPPQIALPMHQQLQKELTEAQRTNKPCGKCHYYLLISKTFTEATKSNSKRKERRNQPKEELMFANAEEEFFHEKALLKFNYSVQEESDTCLGGRWSFDDVPMKPLRTVIVVPADGIHGIMDKLKDYLSL